MDIGAPSRNTRDIADVCVPIVNEKHLTDPDEQELALELASTLEAVHGPLMCGEALSRALGHHTTAALRQAKRRGQVAVPLFRLPNRRSSYALTRDVAAWIAHMRFTNSTAPKEPTTA